MLTFAVLDEVSAAGKVQISALNKFQHTAMCPYDALKTYYYVALSHTTKGVRTQGVDRKSAGKALGGLLVLLYMYHYICVPMLLIPRLLYESSCYAGGLTQRANGKALGGLLANLRRQSVTPPPLTLSPP